MPEFADADKDQSVIIIGAGFAGIGMAIRLQQAGFVDITILEKADEVGGVWRDNSYPGAACDVPSHLYSFSFEPNPRWSHVFAPQQEILDYLKHCADKYNVRRLVRFGVEVTRAHYNEADNQWQLELKDGDSLACRYLITATGQLSRPALPNIAGIDNFKGERFHSARWNHEVDLQGKTVAVIGTGASAVQFVPEIAKQAQRVLVFQRSPNYIMERKDRPYSGFELRMMERFPWLTKLYRLQIYLNFESRSLAFSRFGWLMTPMVKWPFLRLLKKQVKNAAMREQLLPDYPIGCKRILLTSNYLETLERDNVELVTDSINRVTAEGVETDAGTFPADVMVYSTGFAATEFLAPMQVVGKQGIELNDAWQRGAEAYLGITVPQFPNFFMLYGPNTNLGHNSIIYMLESQIAHVMRCVTFMRHKQVAHMQVDGHQFRRFNQRIQQLLRLTVWNGCKSWYIDASGHNSVNWPGSTLRYRLFTKYRALEGYRFDRRDSATGAPVLVEPGIVEAINATILRGFLRATFKALIGPPFVNVNFQRWWSSLLGATMPASAKAIHYQFKEGSLKGEILAPKANGSTGVILYLHGGAYCIGNPATYRSLTSHLSAYAAMDVWVPDYRLAPEPPYPAALEDALAAYELLQRKGYRPGDIVVAGDSAGGGLALALALKLKQEDKPLPAGLMLLSPFVDNSLSGDTLHSKAAVEPMLRPNWLRSGIQHYEGTFPGRSLLEEDISGLPPMMIQVGADEILLADATRLLQQAKADGVDACLEIYHQRWHDFQLAATQLSSARKAIRALADFAQCQTGHQSMAIHSYINPRSAMDTTSPSPTIK
ncbi:MAG: alpha/beta hydrolase [Pseudomonadales bacterium]|nr:alpha/beta hydrolase [Pseudomonadales bacterium]